MEIYCCPAKCLTWLGISKEKQIDAGFLLSSIAVLALAPGLTWIPHVCLFRLISGLPCPGCGITHSIISLMHFDLYASWQNNPAGLFIVAGLVYQLLARPLAMMRPHLQFRVGAISRHINNVALVVLFAVWLLRLGMKALPALL
jgi:hypothetical protein